MFYKYLESKNNLSLINSMDIKELDINIALFLVYLFKEKRLKASSFKTYIGALMAIIKREMKSENAPSLFNKTLPNSYNVYQNCMRRIYNTDKGKINHHQTLTYEEENILFQSLDLNDSYDLLLAVIIRLLKHFALRKSELDLLTMKNIDIGKDEEGKSIFKSRYWPKISWLNFKSFLDDRDKEIDESDFDESTIDGLEKSIVFSKENIQLLNIQLRNANKSIKSKTRRLEKMKKERPIDKFIESDEE